jgi:hypothetical protein
LSRLLTPRRRDREVEAQIAADEALLATKNDLAGKQALIDALARDLKANEEERE